jgi:hypothetical protein
MGSGPGLKPHAIGPVTRPKGRLFHGIANNLENGARCLKQRRSSAQCQMSKNRHFTNYWSETDLYCNWAANLYNAQIWGRSPLTLAGGGGALVVQGLQGVDTDFTALEGGDAVGGGAGGG